MSGKERRWGPCTAEATLIMSVYLIRSGVVSFQLDRVSDLFAREALRKSRRYYIVSCTIESMDDSNYIGFQFEDHLRYVHFLL